MSAHSHAGIDARARMDAMYRHQRHIYDLTRKFYLLGRDDLLRLLPRNDGARICEIGCGTGRNLLKLARTAPGTLLYGIDVSSAMLATARNAVGLARLADRIGLAETEIDDFDPGRVFGVERFDAVFFSYVLSMLPDWRDAVERARALLRPGGLFAAVDFGDQDKASPLRRTLLLAWLRLFDVHPRKEVEQALLGLARAADPGFEHASIANGYAWRVAFRTA